MNKNKSFPTYSIWWLNPSKLCFYAILPFFILCCFLISRGIPEIKESFINYKTFILGFYMVSVWGITSSLHFKSLRFQNDIFISVKWLSRIFWLSSLGTLLVFYKIILNPNLIIQALNESTISTKKAQGWIPGLTTLTHLTQVYIVLLYYIFRDNTPPQKYRRYLYVCFFYVILRVFFMAERVALFQHLFVLYICKISFKPLFIKKNKVLIALIPLLAIIFVFLVFAILEYNRSWSSYRNYYPSYFDFIINRFSFYFTMSINNGAGFCCRNKSFLEIIFNLKPYSKSFLVDYASQEFNNMGPLTLFAHNGLVSFLFPIFYGFISAWAYSGWLYKKNFAFCIFPILYITFLELLRTGMPLWDKILVFKISIIFFIFWSSSKRKQNIS